MSINLSIYEGTSKKDNKTKYEALKVEIGSWSKLIFVNSKFEMDYIKEQLLSDEAKEKELDNIIDVLEG